MVGGSHVVLVEWGRRRPLDGQSDSCKCVETTANELCSGLAEPSRGPPRPPTQHRNGTAGTEDLPRVLTVIAFTSSSSSNLLLRLSSSSFSC